MLAKVNDAIEHWEHVAPLLTAPKTEAEYEQLVESLDEVLDAGGANEDHPFALLADYLGDLVEARETRHYAMPPAASGVEALRFLMEQRGIKQSELPEVGTQSVVSEVLSGKRRLNVVHVERLSNRFNVPADLFIDRKIGDARK